MTSDQADLKLGAAGEGLRRRCNPWRQADRHVPVGRVGKLDILVDRGVAEADLRIIVSSVSPHLQAGFGGGYKMLLPGCSAIETIRGLHRLGLTRRPRRLVGTYAESNPMRAAIDAGGELVDAFHGRTFAVQYLLDNDNLPTAIAAGDILPAQRMLAKQCAAACGVVTPSTADVLITNAYPRDFDLWQSFKCIANTRWAARPNGIIICLARCEGGMEGMNPPRWPISPTWTRRIIRAIGPAAIGSLITRIVPRLAGDAAFFIHLALQTVHRNPLFIVSPALCESGGRFPGLDLFASIEDAVAAAREVLGEGAQRVIVFPSGGTTFPIAPGPQPAGSGSG